MMGARIWTVFLFFLAAFSIIIARLFYWQILMGEDLKTAASDQHSFRFTLPAKRGEIYTADGSPLVMNQEAYLVYAQPREIKNFHEFSDTVSPLLQIPSADILSLISQEGRVWVPLGHKVVSSLAKQLRSLNLPGLGFEEEPTRFYPEASMAAQLVGFVGLDQEGRDTGYFGLEGKYDRDLRGKDGFLEVEKDAYGAPILIGNQTRIEPQNGRRLTLWLDRTVQHIVEKRLLEGIEKYGAKAGSVTVMDPKTGGIIAMASFPRYDPTFYGSFDKELYRNPVVAEGYEPGSTFKALVMAAGLEEKVIRPDTEIQETGPVQVGEYFIRTWNNEYRGTTTMTDVLVHSSNVGMVYIGKELGEDRLKRYIADFGMGKATGIDLADEAVPPMREWDDWKTIDLATATFGQGIAVTPIQMIAGVSALANGGKLMEPHVVKTFTTAEGKETHVKPKVVKTVVSPTATKLITEMMIAAVDSGEAKWAKPKGYRIAGKTGTAQIPVEGHYDEKKTIASFVGFAPADDPKFVMLVTFREPQSSQWGSETAAPLFFTITKDLFLHYNISPK